MQNHYEVNVTPYALNQLQETAQYISGVLQSSENATRWLDTLEDSLASLSFMPSRIPLTEEEPWHSQGIHKMVVKNFLAYFWIDKRKSVFGLQQSFMAGKIKEHNLNE